MYIVKFIDVNNENRCGSEWSRIVDLKTLKGVHNRINKGVKPIQAIGYDVYSVTNIYDENSYRYIERVYYH